MDNKRIQIGKIYKRKPSNKASPYPVYLIPTGVNQLMTTALQTRYYYVDVERERDYGSYECITESSLQVFFELVEGEWIGE